MKFDSNMCWSVLVYFPLFSSLLLLSLIVSYEIYTLLSILLDRCYEVDAQHLTHFA